MAYFANGDVSMRADAENCDLCVHQEDSEGHGCKVMLLHLEWNYEAVGTNGDPTKRMALNTLWPMTDDGYPGQCAMLVEKPPDPGPMLDGFGQW